MRSAVLRPPEAAAVPYRSLGLVAAGDEAPAAGKPSP